MLNLDSFSTQSLQLLRERLELLPQLKPFLTFDQYGALDFQRWSDTREPLKHERYMCHQWMYDHHYLQNFGYVLPTREVMDELANQLTDVGPVLEVGSGSGYLSHELSRLGIETFAVDISKDDLPVFKRDATGDAITHVSGRYGAVLMCWPPFQESFARDVAQAMFTGQFLIYEGENGGGCTGDSSFFDYVSDESIWRRRFDLSSRLDDLHVTFEMFKDHWLTFEKISH